MQGVTVLGKVFERVDAYRDNATKTERKFIDQLKDMDRNSLIYLSITDLAESLGVAEATVLRFCRKLGYKGFQDFKLHLSQDIATDVGDDESKPKRLADEMADSILQAYKQLDYEECLRVADKIIGARKLCVFAVGNSQIAALAVKARLIKAGINAENASDNHAQAIITANLSKNDLLILFSVSGGTLDIIKLAEIAHANGTPVVVITNYSKSPLSKYADYLLYTSRKEAAYEGGSLATVASQIYITDVLCTAVFERLGERATENAGKASGAVSDKSV